MGTTDKRFSQTMRIDLIPESPTEAVAGKKRVVVADATAQPARMPLETIAGADSQYHQLLQSLYDAALVTNPAGIVLDANARAVEFFQCDRSSLLEMSVTDLIAGADEKLLQTLIQNLENERFTLIQAYCMRPDGTFFPSEIAVNKLMLDQPCLLFFVRDISIRRAAEEMLRTEHTALQNSGGGIAVANAEGALEYANPAVVSLWGYDQQEDLIGTDVRQLFTDPATEEMLRLAMDERSAWNREMRALRKDGTEFDVQVSVVCNRNTEGDVVGVVLSFVDIGDRKRAEAAEREAERHRVMIESLGAACHHLSQPATVLLANLGMMQDRVDTTDPAVKELVDMSAEAAKTLSEILHRLHAVTEYKTTAYLRDPSGAGTGESRILDIR
jgi:PAS domain S-box-containing protein